jgi:hypothetical protein
MFEYSNKQPVSLKDREFLNWPSDNQLHKKSCAVWRFNNPNYQVAIPLGCGSVSLGNWYGRFERTYWSYLQGSKSRAASKFFLRLV